jgi:hypothetical protein
MRAHLLVIAFVGIWLGLPVSAAQSAADYELQVKAAFVYQFTRYVEWPTGALEPGAPFSVCVVAQSSVRRAIEHVLEGERFDGRPIRMMTPSTPEAARTCHLLYVEAGAMAQGEPLLGAVERSPVLTISDASDFVENGGHIQLFREGPRVRFDLNRTTATQRGLTLRSQLLRVARAIRVPAANIP